MPLYINELAPWERKNEYFHNVQLGKDVRTQTQVISLSSKAMIESQMASTDAIVASNDRILEGIDDLGYGVEKVEQAIYGLKAAFEWGISEVVWQIEQNRLELRNILEVLSAPLDTQAKELRKRAEEAYANGWVEEALDDFIESEKKNRYDFSIHISIGMIYLFKKINKEKALDYFDKAIKYATPKSKYYTSLALLHKALIKYDFSLIEEAEGCAREAMELSPDFAEAKYQCAHYNALLNKPQVAIPLLEKAIKLDKNYCLKVVNEKDFSYLIDDFHNMIAKLQRNIHNEVSNQYKIITSKINKIKKVVLNANLIINDNINYDNYEIDNQLQRIEILLNRKSYFDICEAQDILCKIEIHQACTKLIQYFEYINIKL